MILNRASPLAHYPRVCVIILCERCKRRGVYSLVRLAVRFGPQATLGEVLFKMVGPHCQYAYPPTYRHKKREMRCHAYLEHVEDGPPWLLVSDPR